MNWRGRPLTSHEVTVDSIAATTTRTGLKVEAELDTGTYDTGVKVTDAEIDPLAMNRHRFHGNWNCTHRPADSLPAPRRQTEPDPALIPTARPAAPPDGVDAPSLRDPEPTGMTAAQLDTLIHELIPVLAQQREQPCHERQDGECQRRQGAGAKDKLSDADRVLATVLCLRRIGTHDLLARLCGVTASTRTRAVQEVRPPWPSTITPSTPDSLRALNPNAHRT